MGSESSVQVVQFPKTSRKDASEFFLGRKRARSASPTSAPTSVSHYHYFIRFPDWKDGSGSYVTTNSSTSSSSSSSSYMSSSPELGQRQPTIVTEYSVFLLSSVMLFVLYLLLPKGLRQYMFNAYPKRYARSREDREIQVLGRKSPRVVIRKSMSASTGTIGGSIPRGYSSSETGSRSRGSSSGLSNMHRVDRIARSGHFNPTDNDLLLANSDATMGSRVDSGITSARLALNAAGSSEATSVSASQSSGVTWTTWGPVPPTTFNGKYYGDNDDGVMSTFKIDGDQEYGEETIDFFTPDSKIQAGPKVSGSESRAGLPSPSLVDIESLACFSQVTPTPSKINGVFITDPSPVHPNSFNGHRVPSQMVLSSTLTSLREPGIRLHAHGTQCDPRRIWVMLNVHTEMIEWKTENVTNKSDGPKFTLGPVHTIALRDVIFVDVGKTTAALQLLSEQDATNDVCFSILTKNGSLDLNAANKLERDAIVSCFCLILDTVYLDRNTDKPCWRDMHSSASSVSSRGTQDQSSYTGASGVSRERSSISNYSPVTASDVFSGIEDL